MIRYIYKHSNYYKTLLFTMLFIIVISLISIKVVFEDAVDIIFFKILIFHVILIC
jgi:hypothetical protein